MVSDCFFFTLNLGKWWTIWRAYFSNGLVQPPPIDEGSTSKWATVLGPSTKHNQQESFWKPWNFVIWVMFFQQYVYESIRREDMFTLKNRKPLKCYGNIGSMKYVMYAFQTVNVLDFWLIGDFWYTLSLKVVVMLGHVASAGVSRRSCFFHGFPDGNGFVWLDRYVFVV